MHAYQSLAASPRNEWKEEGPPATWLLQDEPGEIIVEYKKENENSLPESQPSVASGLPGRECFWVLVPNTKGLGAGGELGLMGFYF